MNEEVKACPFCGADARLGNFIVDAAITCTGCRATITRNHAPREDTGIAEVVAAWNTRTPASCSPDVVADGTLAFALEGADELERLGKAAQSMVGAIPAIIHDDERQRQQSQFHEGEARRWMRLASSVRATADALESMMREKDAMREALTYAAETTTDEHTARKAFEALAALDMTVDKGE